MADEHAPQDPPTPANPPTAPTDGEPAVTPATPDVRELPEFRAALTQEVERVFSERLARERSKIRRELERERWAPTPPTSDDPAATPAPTNGAGRDRVSDLERRLAFSEAANDYGFPRDRRKFLEEHYLAIGAQDPDEWLENFVALMGIGKNNQGTQSSQSAQPATTTTAPPTTTITPPTRGPAPAAPSGPPVSDRGGATAANNVFVEHDPERWTPDHISRLTAEAREAKIDPGRYVRQKFLAGLRGKTIVFPR